MIAKATPLLPELYEADETAWLDAMAELVRTRNLGELDLGHLEEYLVDMAKRDRREVTSRLAILIAHLLKWTFQPEKRSKSWRRTVTVQRQELARLLTSGSLRNHAEAELADAFASAIEQAIVDTDLDEEVFPLECPWTLDQLLSPEILES